MVEDVCAPSVAWRHRDVLVGAEEAQLARPLHMEAATGGRLLASFAAFERAIHVCNDDGCALRARYQVARAIHFVCAWDLRIVVKDELIACRRAGQVGRRRRIVVCKHISASVGAQRLQRAARNDIATTAQRAHLIPSRIGPKNDAAAAEFAAVGADDVCSRRFDSHRSWRNARSRRWGRNTWR